MSWNVLQLSTVENTRLAMQIFGETASAWKYVDPYQNLEWLLDGRDCAENIFFYYYKDDSGNRGLCTLRRQPRSVKMCLGELVLYRHPFMRFELYSAPLIDAKDADTEAKIVTDFLSRATAGLQGSEVLSIEGMPDESALHRLIYSSGNATDYLQLGPAFMHQSIEFPETLDGYLKQLSSRSRKSVQYSQRKLRRDFEVELFCCASEASIDRFLDDGITVSKTTYQWNLLGLGMRDRESFRETLLKWHRSKALRSYLLYCDGKPTAFMLGYIYNSCYFYIDVGYDPQWSKYSVGSVLQMDVIEDLYALSERPLSFDFSTGYGEHKGRFGNREQKEVNVLVMPKSLRNMATRALYLSLDWVTNTVVGLLDRFGLKQRIKRLIRRVA